MRWRGVIEGEPVSAKNSRRLVKLGNRPASIKSAKALAYVEAVHRQVSPLPVLLAGRLRFTATLFYASRRPDLDPALLLDALQGRIYRNDRQVREIAVEHGIDRERPRAEVLVEELEAAPRKRPAKRRAAPVKASGPVPAQADLFAGLQGRHGDFAA